MLINSLKMKDIHFQSPIYLRPNNMQKQQQTHELFILKIILSYNFKHQFKS